MSWSGKNLSNSLGHSKYLRLNHQFFDGITMGKLVKILVLIILFGCFVLLGNLVEVPYTAMVTYTEMEKYNMTGQFPVVEPVGTREKCAEKPDPEYWTTKGFTKKAYEEGYVNLSYQKSEGMTILGMVIGEDGSMYPLGYTGPMINFNCTNITVYEMVLKYKTVETEREVEKQREETFYRPLLEEWGLNFLLLESIKGKFTQILEQKST